MTSVEFKLLTKIFLSQSFQENPFSCEQFASILLSHNLPLYNPSVKVHPLNCVARVCPEHGSSLAGEVNEHGCL